MEKFDLIRKFSEWYLRKKYTKIQKQDQQNKEKQSELQKKLVLQRVQLFRAFVKDINENILPNRKARKNFWRREGKGEPVLELYLDQIIQYYSHKPNTEKKEEKK